MLHWHRLSAVLFVCKVHGFEEVNLLSVALPNLVKLGWPLTEVLV